MKSKKGFLGKFLYSFASDIHENTHLCKRSHNHVFSMTAKTQTDILFKKKTSDGENQSFIIKSMCGKSSRSKSMFVENKISINLRGRLPYCLRRKNKFLTWPFLFISCSFTLSKGRPLKVFINWVQMRSSLHALLLQKHNFKEDQGHNMQLISQQSSHFVSPRWPIDLPVL